MKKESLIGKKVKGFKFKSRKYENLFYSSDMDERIGEVGEIKDHSDLDDSYNVKFKKDDWWYPAALIEKHLADPIHPLIITKQTKVRAGKKYYTWQMSKNKKVVNHQYNSAAGRNKQLAQFIEDIRNGNFEIK